MEVISVYYAEPHRWPLTSLRNRSVSSLSSLTVTLQNDSLLSQPWFLWEPDFFGVADSLFCLSETTTRLKYTESESQSLRMGNLWVPNFGSRTLVDLKFGRVMFPRSEISEHDVYEVHFRSGVKNFPLPIFSLPIFRTSKFQTLRIPFWIFGSQNSHPKVWGSHVLHCVGLKRFSKKLLISTIKAREKDQIVLAALDAVKGALF